MLTNMEKLLDLPELADVFLELHDSRYVTRLHGSRSTYAIGCHGPLCKKAERDRGRRRNEHTANGKGRTYQPGLDWRLFDRDELLEAIYLWHRAKREEQKISRLVR